ncbi:hypothetical protein OH492_04430 [Vibrio chagasii]|nr:hypothetical protein [Vibrio chagasii]
MDANNGSLDALVISTKLYLKPDAGVRLTRLVELHRAMWTGRLHWTPSAAANLLNACAAALWMQNMIGLRWMTRPN